MCANNTEAAHVGTTNVKKECHTVMDVSMTHPNGNSHASLLQSNFSKFLRGRNVLFVLEMLCEYNFGFSPQICCAVIRIVVCH